MSPSPKGTLEIAPGDRIRQYADCGHPVPCGCEYLPPGTCCEECPIPRECLLEVEGGPRAMALRARNERIAVAYAGGQTALRLADRYGLSGRQVFRIVEGQGVGRT